VDDLSRDSETRSALQRARQIAEEAAEVGFDWDDVAGVLDKVREEIDELVEAMQGNGDVEHELGDLLFALVNLGRFLGIDPDAALEGANMRFTRRFAAVEAGLREKGVRPQDATLDEMEALWQRAKAGEGS